MVGGLISHGPRAFPAVIDIDIARSSKLVEIGICKKIKELKGISMPDSGKEGGGSINQQEETPRCSAGRS
jgi:hypothetical protein